MSDLPTISVPSYGGSGRKDGGCMAQVAGLLSEEVDTLRASMLAGHHWVRRNSEGRLESVPSYEKLPGPITDEKMLPYWRRATDAEMSQENLFGFEGCAEADLQSHSPSIFISGLCGYDYTEERYKHQAQILTDWGFVCMRSQRSGNSGQYWETWYFPGSYAAKGRLREAIDNSSAKNEAEKIKVIVEFLRTNARFGSLDVSVQRLAMVIAD
jgi:hypothetical protein